MIVESILVVGFTILLDFKFGDPRNKYHLTAIGSLIAKLTPVAKNELCYSRKIRWYVCCRNYFWNSYLVTFYIIYWNFFDYCRFHFINCFSNHWRYFIENYHCYSWNGKTCNFCTRNDILMWLEPISR